jgi:pimeloyl-ACP methyl ester carboxylesterase
MNIVFVHGMWSQAWVWEHWKARFEHSGHRCLALTLPGHERAIHELPAAEQAQASLALAKLGVQEYTQAVCQAVQAHNDGSGVVLVGHSMGGLLSLMAATAQGTRLAVNAVISVSGAAPAPVFPLRLNTLAGTARHFSHPLLYRRGFRLSAWEAQYLLFNAMPEAQARELSGKIVHESGRAAFQLAFGPLNLAGSNRYPPEALRCPVLLLAGGKDRIVPLGAIRSHFKWLKHRSDDPCELREYPQAAHWLLGEPGWEAAADDSLQWLTALKQFEDA